METWALTDQDSLGRMELARTGHSDIETVRTVTAFRGVVVRPLVDLDVQGLLNTSLVELLRECGFGVEQDIRPLSHGADDLISAVG